MSAIPWNHGMAAGCREHQTLTTPEPPSDTPKLTLTLPARAYSPADQPRTRSVVRSLSRVVFLSLLSSLSLHTGPRSDLDSAAGSRSALQSRLSFTRPMAKSCPIMLGCGRQGYHIWAKA